MAKIVDWLIGIWASKHRVLTFCCIWCRTDNQVKNLWHNTLRRGRQVGQARKRKAEESEGDAETGKCLLNYASLPCYKLGPWLLQEEEEGFSKHLHLRSKINCRCCNWKCNPGCRCKEETLSPASSVQLSRKYIAARCTDPKPWYPTQCWACSTVR